MQPSQSADAYTKAANVLHRTFVACILQVNYKFTVPPMYFQKIIFNFENWPRQRMVFETPSIFCDYHRVHSTRIERAWV